MDSKQIIDEYFTADDSGNVILKKPTNRSALGDIVGHKMLNGYIAVMLPKTRRKVYAHQIIYYIRFGVWLPDVGLEVDHIDRDRANNRPDNLRAVTTRRNSFNKGASNVSAYKVKNGVHYRVQLKAGLHDRGDGIVVGAAGFKSREDAEEFAALARETLR